jgi:protein disulfide-isomerase
VVRLIKIIIPVLVFVIGFTACRASDKDARNYDSKSAAMKADSLAAEGTPVEWMTDYQQALKTAKDKNHPILIDFTGSDWCIWCQRLDKEVFSEKAFADYAKGNLVLLKLDFPKSLPQSKETKAQNDALAQQFKIEGFPTVIILNPGGKEIARTGYQEGGAVSYTKHLKSLIK